MKDCRYIAFDIETAKILPDKTGDLLSHRPLGIACAAAFALDTGKATIWHGVTASGSPAPLMSRDEAKVLVADLSRLVADGYTLVTWNGLAFDFDVLGEESSDHDSCVALALEHVDMMFHVVCSRGHRLALQKAAEGMSVPGKLSGVSGAKAPRMWAEEKHQLVLDYNVQDVRAIAQVAAAGDQARALSWITGKGRKGAMPLPNGWLPVREAIQLPEPSTSWMTDPPRRETFLAWTR